jgi:predicted metalloprotease with PDZ domain
VVAGYQTGSPWRRFTQVGDEVVALDGVRIRSPNHLSKLVSGRAGQTVNLDVAHEGIVNTVEVEIGTSPQHGVTLSGKGNERWTDWITSRQDR